MSFLSLKKFTDVKKLQEANLFTSDNVFDYLGTNLEQWILNLLNSNSNTRSYTQSGLNYQSGLICIHESAEVGNFVEIIGPVYISAGAKIKHGALIRGPAYIGANAVVGHASEIKGSILLDNAHAPHFAYVGDSILGQHTNLGAGTKIANLRLKKDNVKYTDPDTRLVTNSGLRKFGAVLGDRVQTGCNCVLSPGSLLLPDSTILPCEHFKGTK